MLRASIVPVGKVLSQRKAGTAGAMLRVLLLVALTVAGSVPQGLMRTARADGMELVLCTPDGPKELWMTADGEIHEDQPTHEEEHSGPKCLNVTLAMAALTYGVASVPLDAGYAAYQLETDNLRVVRAPVAAAHQPRAPPSLI